VKTTSALEKQVASLQSQVAHHRRARDQTDSENQRLRERVQRYDDRATTTGDDGSVVQIPAAELRALREQERMLDGLESSVARLEASEKALKEAVEKLREGKVRSLFSDF
jgi:chromosome segregation ATPase